MEPTGIQLDRLQVADWPQPRPTYIQVAHDEVAFSGAWERRFTVFEQAAEDARLCRVGETDWFKLVPQRT
jgi:hypothetical protein